MKDLTKRELRNVIAANFDIPWNVVVDILEKKHGYAPTIKDVLDYKADTAILYASILVKKIEIEDVPRQTRFRDDNRIYQ